MLYHSFSRFATRSLALPFPVYACNAGYISSCVLACVAGGISCASRARFGSEAVNVSGEAVRGLVKSRISSRVEFHSRACYATQASGVCLGLRESVGAAVTSLWTIVRVLRLLWTRNIFICERPCYTKSLGNDFSDLGSSKNKY